ncbi:MAG: 50S ribosomal protein L29 [bacterium]|nr:50S ribosomal protein L29 [bacterium]
MKIEEIRNLSKDELLNKVESLKEELMRLRFNKKSGQLTDTSVIRKTKRDISKMLTVLTEKETKKQQ